MKVCIVSEGSYPIVRGGLSEWAHLLIKTLPDIEFDVYCIAPDMHSNIVYEKLPNVRDIVIHPLIDVNFPMYNKSVLSKVASVELAQSLVSSLHGTPMDFNTIIDINKTFKIDKWWLTNPDYWDSIVAAYQNRSPDSPFAEYYWGVFGLYSILIDSLNSIQTIPKADVYHSLSTGFAGMAASLAKIIYGSPLVITEQGLYLKERLNELSRQHTSTGYVEQIMRFSESIVRTSYKYADKVVPPCDSHIPLELELGVELSKIHRIDNGIECDKFTPGPSKNGHTPLVGCFARVVPIKGLITLIEAAKLIGQKHQADFVVVGEIQDQDYHEQCQSLVDQLGMREHFRFIGHANPLEWYHKIDIFVLSSVSEGVPYALLEAMSCGIPSVCTAVGGIPEILSGNAGYVVPPNAPDRISEKIGELLSDEALRKDMGHRATQVAHERYTIQKMAEEFRKLYEELSNGNN